MMRLTSNENKIRLTARSRESEAVEAPREVSGVAVFVLQRASAVAVNWGEWNEAGAQIRRGCDVISGAGRASALHENMTIR